MFREGESCQHPMLSACGPGPDGSCCQVGQACTVCYLQFKSSGAGYGISASRLSTYTVNRRVRVFHHGSISESQ